MPQKAYQVQQVGSPLDRLVIDDASEKDAAEQRAVGGVFVDLETGGSVLEEGPLPPPRVPYWRLDKRFRVYLKNTNRQNPLCLPHLSILVCPSVPSPHLLCSPYSSPHLLFPPLLSAWARASR